MIKTTGTVVFDMIGTCFSLDLPRQRLIELGAPGYKCKLVFWAIALYSLNLAHISNNGVKTIRKAGAFIVVGSTQIGCIQLGIG